MTRTQWRKEIDKVLISEKAIALRVAAMARQIEKDYSGKDMVIVALLNGTVLFLADLVRHLSLPLRLDFIGVSSYGQGTESGNLVFTKELRLDVSVISGPHVAVAAEVRMDRAHRRYLTAIKTLAIVRKLALPVLQVNIAKKQVNVAGSPPA